MKRKPRTKATMRKSWDMRRTRRIEIHFTEEEETTADLMWMEFQESVDFAASQKGEEPPACSFSDFLAILLRRQLDAYRRECDDAAESEELIP
jgi:hypothetical protein